MRKKIFAILCTFLLTLGLMSGCSETDKPAASSDSTPNESIQEQTPSGSDSDLDTDETEDEASDLEDTLDHMTETGKENLEDDVLTVDRSVIEEEWFTEDQLDFIEELGTSEQNIRTVLYCTDDYEDAARTIMVIDWDTSTNAPAEFWQYDFYNSQESYEHNSAPTRSSSSYTHDDNLMMVKGNALTLQAIIAETMYGNDSCEESLLNYLGVYPMYKLI